MHLAVQIIALLLLAVSADRLLAQSGPQSPPDPAAHGTAVGAVVAPVWQSRELSLVNRDRGFGLGHSDLSVDAALMPGLSARLSGVAHSDHSSIETELEEAYLDAPGLPGGLQLRVGRFLSQLGYLNEQHPHTDEFSIRPVLYRAFLGDHYFDDGLRLNWVAPTPVFWRVGGELLGGRRLPESAGGGSPGAWTLGTRIGGDLGRSSSWQVGLSTLRHRNGASGAAGEVDDHASHAGGVAIDGLQAHRHGAVFFGRQLDVIDLVWKWAPDGNSRARQLRLSSEFARVRGLGESEPSSAQHRGWYVSLVYRFLPQWEAGMRLERLDARALHEEGWEPARLAERSVSIAWKPSHMRLLRLQWTAQRDRGGFAEAAAVAPGRALFVQFVQSFGAHGAHSF